MTSSARDPGGAPERRISLAFELFAVTQRLGLVLEQRMAPTGVRPSEYAVYSLMAEAGARTPTELARMMGMAPTTMSDHLRRLMARGHVRRLRNRRDGRSHLVILTAEGRATMQTVEPLFREAIADIEARLPRPPGEILDAVRAYDSALRGVLRDAAPQADDFFAGRFLGGFGGSDAA